MVSPWDGCSVARLQPVPVYLQPGLRHRESRAPSKDQTHPNDARRRRPHTSTRLYRPRTVSSSADGSGEPATSGPHKHVGRDPAPTPLPSPTPRLPVRVPLQGAAGGGGARIVPSSPFPRPCLVTCRCTPYSLIGRSSAGSSSVPHGRQRRRRRRQRQPKVKPKAGCWSY